jgi:hypothetical protein
MTKWHSWKETNLRTKALLVLLFLPSVIVFTMILVGLGVWDGVGWWLNKISGWFE